MPQLTTVLRSLGIDATVVDIIEGPTVNQYRLDLKGTPVRKLETAHRDIALGLGQADVRIVAPIPGTNLVGVETQAVERSTVDWEDVEYHLADEQRTLPIALGVDTSGEPVVADLAKLPHLLVAGQTGSGKSVGLDAIIASLALGTDPAHVRLHLGDPKRVELSRWADLPHVEAPVATDHSEIADLVADLVVRMEQRYELFEQAGVRNIAAYNANSSAEVDDHDREPLAYHVLIIDEMADLLMGSSGKAIEADLVRLAQLARAAGIHMVLATQRPIVQVITGNLKANIPSRWAFTVMGTTDSMTILDRPDAKRLYGAGDSLALLPGSNDPTRVQAPYVTEDDVEQIIEQVTEQFADLDVVDELVATEDDEVPADFAPPVDVEEAIEENQQRAVAEAFDSAKLFELTSPAARAARDAGRAFKPTPLEPFLAQQQSDARALAEVAESFRPAAKRIDDHVATALAHERSDRGGRFADALTTIGIACVGIVAVCGALGFGLTLLGEIMAVM